MAGLEIRYSYKDAPTIRAFSQSNAFIRGLMGPWRSGKSSGCVVELVKRGQAMPPCSDGIRRSRIVVVRNTYNQLKDTTIKTVHQWLPPAYFGTYNATDHDYRIEAFDGCHIEINFRALDRPDHVAKLLSYEATFAWVNEAREVPWTIIEALQGRVGQFPPLRECGPYWHGLWLDTNPPDQDSRWYRFFEEEGHDPKFAQIFRQPSGLSPGAENVANLVGGREYYVRLSTGKSDEWVKVYIHGQYGFVVEGKPVYAAEYDDGSHCTEKAEPVRGVTIYRGWDFGLTPACILMQPQPSGRFVVFDELCAESMGVERFADDVLEHCGRNFRGEVDFTDIGDPAGQSRSETDEKTCFQILQGKGVLIEPGLQTPSIRWESVRKPLNTFMGGRPQFQLNPRCKILRKGFLGGYHFRRLQTTGERYSEKAEKNQYSHPHDALQYPCTVIFGGALIEPRSRGRHDDDEVVLLSDPTRNPVTGY